jgi:hypothetical protein
MSLVVLGIGAMMAAPTAGGQERRVSIPLAVGAPAPDFEIPGATRYGVLRDPITLSDFRGKTVVLAFFFRARSGG